MRWIPKLFLLLFTLILLMGNTGSVAADSLSHTTSPSISTPIVVPKGSTTDDVIAVNRDATILGTVTETLLVVNGTAHLLPTANVGLVVNIGGHVIREPGAQVKESFAFTFSKPLFESLAVGAALALGLEAVRLAFSIVMILLPVIVALLMGERLKKPISFLEQSIRRVGVIGLLTFFGSLAVSLILAVTVIGIPVSVLIVVAYVGVGLVGMSALSAWVGNSLFSAVITNQRLWVKTLVGAVLITACANIPAIGPILFILLWMTGTGSVAAWLWQNRFRKRGN